MQLALRPYVTVGGVAVLGAGLIYVTPVAAPHIEQRAVEVAAGQTLSDLVGPIDTVVNSLGDASGPASASVSDALPSLAGLDSAQYLLLDAAFWQEFWNALLDPASGPDPSLLLTGAIEQLPVIGPLLEGFGLFVVFPVSLLLAYGWSLLSEAFGLQPYAAAADGLGTGLQGVQDAALAGLIDPSLPAGVNTPWEITPLLSDAARILDPTALLHDVSTVLDPTVLMSVLDLNPITDIGTVVDSAGIADIGTLLSTSTIPDLGAILTSLIP